MLLRDLVLVEDAGGAEAEVDEGGAFDGLGGGGDLADGAVAWEPAGDGGGECALVGVGGFGFVEVDVGLDESFAHGGVAGLVGAVFGDVEDDQAIDAEGFDEPCGAHGGPSGVVALELR